MTELLICGVVITHTQTHTDEKKKKCAEVRFLRQMFQEQNFGPNIVCLYKHVFYPQEYEDVFYHIVFEALGCRWM